MDYEKEYKELVGKIDKAYLYAQTDSTKAVLEEIRPELKETVDERIRKEFCKDIWTFIPNEKAHKYIAWLEKQGCEVNCTTTWKPSAKQLTALERAVNDNTLSCDELYTLNELYEQLKKLR